MNETSLLPWLPDIRHALAVNARVRRDADFGYPSVDELKAALAGRMPANAADMRAIIATELARIDRDLRQAVTTPWREYWNVRRYERVCEPRPENLCRNRLLGELNGRLERYQLRAEPESLHSENTRADIALVAWNGARLPIEIKRHDNAQLWTAASTQLQHYANHPEAHGFGVYLVFWFGADAFRVPSRPDGASSPSSAAELRRMLKNDLPFSIRARTDVYVLDVSPAAEGGAAAHAARASAAAADR